MFSVLSLSDPRKGSDQLLRVLFLTTQFSLNNSVCFDNVSLNVTFVKVGFSFVISEKHFR